ncbi:MAG: hypothetical protein J7501_02585, partial [Bdellovibrio sp.]|nr:hypothetical protein [Bdellovibrio sp.]
PQSTFQFAETVQKVNPLLSEKEKIVMPPQSSSLLYDSIYKFNATGSNKEITKKVLEISKLAPQGCNAYATETFNLRVTEFHKGLKIALTQVAKEGNLKKAASLNELTLAVAQCKGPFIVNLIGQSFLKDSLDTLKGMNGQKLKKSDKARLQALKEEILKLNSQEILRDSMRFEVLATTTLLTAALNAPTKGEATPTDTSILWANLSNGKNFVANWNDISKITADVFKTVNQPSTPELPEYQAEIAKQTEDGYKKLWTALNLKKYGFEKAEDLKDEKKFEAWFKKLDDNKDLATEVNQKLATDPQVSTAIFQLNFATMNVRPESLKKFDTKFKDLQKEAATLVN